MKLRLSLLSLLLTLSFVPLSAQGVHYSTGFETAADTVGWVFLNGTQTNQWHVGTAANQGISHSLYISNDGGITNAYTGDSISVVYAYYEFTLVDSFCNIRFDWCCKGWPSLDFMRVYVVPDSVTPTPGVLPRGARYTYHYYTDTVPDGWIQIGPAALLEQTAWQHVDTMLTLAPATYRLLFVWCNSGMMRYVHPPEAIDNVVIDEPLCPAPRNLRFSNISSDSCLLSCDSPDSAVMWSVEYGTLPLAPGSGFNLYAYDTAVTLYNLIPNTLYEVYVRAECSSMSSPAVHGIFRTACNAMSLPIVENFENWVDTVSSCWYRSPGTVTTPYYPYISTDYAYSGSRSIRFTASNDVYLALPYTYADDSVQGLTLSFWAYKASTSTTPNLVYVGVMTDPHDVSTFTVVDTIPLTTAYLWRGFEVPLSSYVGTGRYVALRSPSGSTYIDDITLDHTSACLTPSNLTLSDITADSCTVFWSERGLAVRYAVEYSVAPIVPGTGAARTLYVNSNICRLGGLLPNTTYYVYVRALCGSSSSFWLQGSFRTMCQPVQLPFSEDFSSWSVGPLYGIDSVSCWRFGTNDDPSNTFRIIDGTDAHSETHNAIFAAGNGKYSYMTLPVVGVPVRSLTLSLWLKKYGGTDSLVFVGVMDNPYDIATYTPVDTLTLVEHWQSYSVSFDSYTNQGRCVALMTKSCWVYVDDIFLNYSRGCFVPTDLRVSAVTSNSVTLKWTSCPNSITSLIEYGFAGFTYGTGTVITSTTNTITVTGLLTNTNYDFYLRDVCGLDTSGATLPVSAQPGAWITRLNETDTVELCGNVLYDDGGPTGNYNHGQNSTVILKPSIPGYKVYIYGTYQCLYSDIMYVYDGIGTGGTLLARFSCPSSSAYNVPAISVGPVRASDSSGALTVLFIGRSMCPGYALNVVCGRPIPHPQCDPPSSLSVLGVTNSSATVSWGDTGFFQVTCKEDWNRYWPEGFYVSDTGYTFTGLFTGMPYEWRVRKICEVEGYSDTTDWVYSTFTTSGGDIPCDMPHGIAVREYTATTATVTWVGSGIYDVDYRKTGTSEWSSCTQINANEYTITGLSPATQYQWRVRRVCADDVHSSWTGGTFTTSDTDGITAADLGGVSIAVYPNPAAPGSDVEVSIKGAYGPVTLTLYDVAGRALQSVAQAIPTAPSACFHLQAPSRGTYFLKLRTPTSTTTHKLVIR